MGKKKSTVAGRAWRLLRLPLHWSKKSLGNDSGDLKTKTFCRHCSEREFSFEDTPSYQFKAVRRSVSICLLPCITPAVDFDDEDEDEVFFQKSGDMKHMELEESDEDHAHTVDEEEGSETQSELSSARFSKSYCTAKFSKSTTVSDGPEICFSDEEREEDWDSETTWSDAMPETGEDEEDQEIDSKAEKFITEFYEKIKLQRHSSPLGRDS